MTGKRLRSPNADELSTAPSYTKACTKCGTVDSWDYSSNGDGASIQICKRCGMIYSIGRYYQDHAVGFRVIAYSMLSATFTPKPTEE